MAAMAATPPGCDAWIAVMDRSYKRPSPGKQRACADNP